MPKITPHAGRCVGGEPMAITIAGIRQTHSEEGARLTAGGNDVQHG